jgi:hypothetical protein
MPIQLKRPVERATGGVEVEVPVHVDQLWSFVAFSHGSAQAERDGATAPDHEEPLISGQQG